MSRPHPHSYGIIQSTETPMDRKALEAMLARGQDNAMLRYTLGTLLFKEGDYPAAAQHLEAGLKLDPNHSATWKFFARSLMELGRRDEAETAFRSGIEVGESRGDVQAVKEMRVFLKRLLKNEAGRI